MQNRCCISTKQPRAAIETARRFAYGEVTHDELVAADAAADAAAWAVAAARAAAAAYAAADADAAAVAAAAADAAVRATQTDKLKEMITCGHPTELSA